MRVVKILIGHSSVIAACMSRLRARSRTLRLFRSTLRMTGDNGIRFWAVGGRSMWVR